MRTVNVLAIVLAVVGLSAAIGSRALASDGGPTDAGQGAAAPASHVTAEPDLLVTGGDMVEAVRSGQWRLAASLALGIIMLLLGKVRNEPWSPFKGDRGGAILVMLLAFCGASGTALASSAPLDWKLALGTLGIAWTAVGGYGWFKRLLWPVVPEPAPAPTPES